MRSKPREPVPTGVREASNDNKKPPKGHSISDGLSTADKLREATLHGETRRSESASTWHVVFGDSSRRHAACIPTHSLLSTVERRSLSMGATNTMIIYVTRRRISLDIPSLSWHLRESKVALPRAFCARSDLTRNLGRNALTIMRPLPVTRPILTPDTYDYLILPLPLMLLLLLLSLLNFLLLLVVPVGCN